MLGKYFYPCFMIIVYTKCILIRGFSKSGVYMTWRTSRNSFKLKTLRNNRMSEAYTNALNELNNERKPEILCFGDAFYDTLATVDAAGLPVEQMISKGKWEREPGGESFNVALALAKLGATTAFAGAIGDDRDGRALGSALKRAGVLTDLVQLTNSPTRRVLVARDADCEPVFSGFHKGYPSSSFADAKYQMQMEHLEQTLYHQNLKWVISGTIGLAFKQSWQSHLELLRWTNKHNIPLMVDVNWRPQFWNCSSGYFQPTWEQEARRKIQAFCNFADLMKVTAKEASWLTALPRSEIIQDPGVLRDFFPNCKGFLVTNGKEDICFDILGHTGYVEPPSVPHVDEIGAGDAFCAGFLYKMKSVDLNTPLNSSMRNAITDAVKFGSVVGALATTKVGCVEGQPCFYEALDMYRKYPGKFRLHFASAFTPHLEDEYPSE